MQIQKPDTRKLMCVLAHPDDESLGTGGLLAHYAEHGVETHLITATRGQRGWHGSPRDNPGPDILGQRRTAELEAAAAVLGVHHLEVLDYMDGELADAPAREIIDTLVGHLRRVRPQVVVTFGQDGVYGHPDHIAISQFTTAAVLAAANPSYPAGWDWPPHQVSKLYYFGFSQERWEQFCSAFGTVTIDIDGATRQHLGWEDWMVWARLDTGSPPAASGAARRVPPEPARGSTTCCVNDWHVSCAKRCRSRSRFRCTRASERCFCMRITCSVSVNLQP